MRAKRAPTGMEEDFLETRKNGLTGGVHTTTGVKTDAFSVLEKKKETRKPIIHFSPILGCKMGKEQSPCLLRQGRHGIKMTIPFVIPEGNCTK